MTELHLRCPRCGESLPNPGETGIDCGSCGERYPVRAGVIYLAYLDSNWKHYLQEIAAYHDMYRRFQEREIEADRAARKENEAREGLGLMNRLLFEGLESQNFDGNPVTLDVGAGGCEVSAALAERGARVTALDLNPMDLANPRRITLGDDPKLSFWERMEGVDSIDVESKGIVRIVGDVENLPFEDGSFDLVVCRSVLHHARNLDRALAEMARVCRTGGRLLAISEPLRTVLDNEREYTLGDLDREEGIHEGFPSMHQYAGAIRKAGLEDLSVFCTLPFPGFRVSRLLSIAGFKADLPLLDGRTFRGPWLWFLRFLTGACNLSAFKKCPTARRRPMDPSRPAIGSVDLLTETSERIREIRRLARDAASPENYPDSILAADEDSPVLLRGFRDPEEVDGRRARYLLRESRVLMRTPGSARVRLELDLYGPGKASKPPMEVRVTVNDGETETLRLYRAGWRRLSLDLEAGEEPILEIHLCTTPLHMDSQGRELGPALYSVSVMPLPF